MQSIDMLVVRRALLVALALLPLALAHQSMIVPTPRTGDCLVNGILMGTKIGLGTSGEPVQNNDRPMLMTPHPYYQKRPCGACRQAGFSTTVELCKPSTENMFNFTMASPISPIPSYAAGSEIELSFKGYIHPGVISVRLCYENCMNMDSYEKYILGYWFVEGTGGPSSDIYSPVLKVKVRLPNRNCNNCVLQLLADVQDLRSYVDCADIKITGATANAVDASTCNGHPYCDCSATSTANVYGLGKRCPIGIASSGTNHGVLKGMNKTEFCGLCPSNGCPASCGGIYLGTYNGANVLGGTHTSALPKYVTCSAATPCNCPGCNSVATFTPAPTTVATWKVSDWSMCPVTCGTGVQSRTVSCMTGSTQVANSKCVDPMPETTQACSVNASCTATWLTSEYGPCNKGLNRMSRNAFCFDQGSLVDDSACTQTRPATSQLCTTSCSSTVRADGSIAFDAETGGSSNQGAYSTRDFIIGVVCAGGGAAALILMIWAGVTILARRRSKQLDKTRQAQAALDDHLPTVVTERELGREEQDT